MKSNISDLGSPIARQTNAEQVVQRILGLIQAGVLVAEQQLPSERELAANLGVSRPSLREALRALSLMGALNIRQGGGVFVSSLSSQDLLGPLDFYFNLDNQRLETLFEAQIMLESEVARLAAGKITDEVIEQLEACLKQTEPVLNALLAWFEMDTQFHMLIAQSTGNIFLERVVQSVRTLINRNRKATVQSWSIPRISHAEHLKVLEALRARDPEAAAGAMRAHLERVRAAHAKFVKAQAKEKTAKTAPPKKASTTKKGGR
jgi:GntR family transcriptional regulator, transcriptional repressor for pyruvate dehydrogenase complex